MTDAISPSDLDQTNYMKLFMQELSYQDPLKPIDNREFMAQMAQFSALQEARSTNEHLSELIGMNAASQSLTLLGKNVRIKDAEGIGRVSKLQFFDKAPTMLTVSLEKGGTMDVEIKQISEVEA
jgi:flagellar basal-body rod modification protein FlgD